MTKRDKHYRQLLRDPQRPLAFRDFITVIRDFGFVEIRIRGSHRSYKHPAAATLLVVQPRGHDAKPYQQKQFLDMIEEYGLERPTE